MLLEKYVFQQTYKGPLEWTVVGERLDGYKFNMGQTVIHRTDDNSNLHSINANYLGYTDDGNPPASANHSQGVARGGGPVELSAREFKLLRHFIAHRGATVSREELLSEVWGYDETPLTRTVDVHVAGLRQKVDNPKSPEFIVTVHGLGYKFVG